MDTVLQQLISKEELHHLLQELGVGDVSREKKEELLGKMVHAILERVFQRVATVLTAEDIATFQQLDSQDTTGNTGKYFLMTKVPNLEAILKEEVRFFKEDITGTSAAAS